MRTHRFVGVALVVALAVLPGACSGSTPTSPTDPGGPPPPATVTLQVKYTRMQPILPQFLGRNPDIILAPYSGSGMIDCQNLVRVDDYNFTCNLPDVPVSKQGDQQHQFWASDVARYDGTDQHSVIVSRLFVVNGVTLNGTDAAPSQDFFWVLWQNGQLVIKQ